MNELPELVRGSRVRFQANFKTASGPMDPPGVFASFASPRKSYILNSTDGGVRRSSPGVYEADVVVDQVGTLTVRFESSTGEFVEMDYRVIRSAPAALTNLPAELVADVTTADPVADDDDEQDEIAAGPSRDEMISALDADGIEIEVDRSDTYVSAAYVQMINRPPTPDFSPRGRYLARQRRHNR